MPRIVVDGKELEVKEGATLLASCLANDIYIPNLCYLEASTCPSASCRLCFVEIAGFENPVAACTARVSEGMQVRTDTDQVRRLQRTAFKLLLSAHRIECRECPANGHCELRMLARFLKVGLRPKPIEPVLKRVDPDPGHPQIEYFPHRCVLCGRCVEICRQRTGRPIFTFAKRGFHTVISAFGAGDSQVEDCRDCRQCVGLCPVGALITREN